MFLVIILFFFVLCIKSILCLSYCKLRLRTSHSLHHGASSVLAEERLLVSTLSVNFQDDNCSSNVIFSLRYKLLPNRQGGVSGFGVPPASRRPRDQDNQGGGWGGWGRGHRLGNE